MFLENFMISNVIFARQAIFSTLYIGTPQVNRIIMISGAMMSVGQSSHAHMLIYRHYKLRLHFDTVWLVV